MVYSEPIILLSIVGIIITVLLFFVENKIQSIDERVVQNLFHMNEFAASQNMMTELKLNNLNVSLSMLRTSFISFYALVNDGKGPSKTQIEEIKSEGDYLARINPVITNEKFKKVFTDPLGHKKTLEYIQLALFISLVLSQLGTAWLSKNI